MRQIVIFVLPAFLASASIVQATEYDCVMKVESSIEGVVGLDSHKYRIRKSSLGYQLDQHTADGTWMDFGIYQNSKTDDFDVFVRLSGVQDGPPAVSMITVNLSGRAAILTHNGSWGNTQQYQRAWLTQGVCEPRPL